MDITVEDVNAALLGQVVDVLGWAPLPPALGYWDPLSPPGFGALRALGFLIFLGNRGEWGFLGLQLPQGYMGSRGRMGGRGGPDPEL